MAPPKKMQALDTKVGPNKAKPTMMKDLVTTGGGQSKRKSKTQAKAA